MLTVKILQTGDARRWDAFVQDCPEASFFHRAGWSTVLERAYGHRTHYLYAERGGRIEGVLPLGHIKSRLFGNALVSNPFCVYGGVAANDESVAIQLEDAAATLAADLGVDYLELRNRRRQRTGWPVKELYVTFRKPIDPDPATNLKAIPRKQRAMVRKGIKAGLESQTDAGPDRFFAVYAESVRNLGTPVFPKEYFQCLCDVFGEDCNILTVTTADGRAVSSVLSFFFRDEVLPYYGGGRPEARALKGYDFLYWELMRRAGEQGCRMFDYGRSKVGTGSYSFKKNWGFEPEPLPYQFHLVKAKQLPDVNPLNPKYQLFISLWKKLPLPVANRLGPMVSRNLG